ncbi:type IV toxin-antitoxin system AbiEi family antitoxin domain-containing protein [Pontiella desulfatans]|nr:type IV toxin-antitoxin system AbiEi family antitoxin [Pontiella desulfatans]
MKAYIDHFVEELLSTGRYSFSRSEISARFDVGDDALRQSLHRLARAGKIQPLRGGFYVIVPPEYKSRGMLPPEMIIDDLMRHIGRTYYVGLLSASALHGAAHQQPQSFATIISKPSIRSIQVQGLNLVFPVKSVLPSMGIEKRKSPSGYFELSSPELTAIDLLIYYRQCGGVAAVVPVLEELIELMDGVRLARMIGVDIHTAPVQRLGFILDVVLGEGELGAAVMSVLEKRDYFHIPLVPGVKNGNCPIDSKWKINVNADLEDEL